jgi:hypothetical protein
MASEPGLDRHEWESEWASLEDDMADAPEAALRHAHELITRMLTERAVLDESLVALEGADPEWVKTWEEGRDLVRRLEDPTYDVSVQEVLDQIEEYRGVFTALLEQRGAP